MGDETETLDQIFETLSPVAEAMRTLYPICLERKQLVDRVKRLMDWDDEKTMAWFKTPNFHFGGSSPDMLMVARRSHVVEAFIKEAEANKVSSDAY